MKFKRDRLTIFSYLMIGFFMLSRSILAPFVSYRSTENPAETSLWGFHITVSAIGIILVGIFWKNIRKYYFGKYLMYFSSFLLALGASLLASNSIAVTLGAAFILGAAGSILNIMVNMVISDHHGSNKKIAIGEAAIVSSIFGSIAPVILSLSNSFLSSGWKAGLLVPAIVLGIIILSHRKSNFLDLLEETRGNHKSAENEFKVNTNYRLWLLLLVLCSASEWGMVYWSSSLVEYSGKLAIDLAVLSVSLIIIFQIFGRAVWTHLSKSIDIGKLLIACLGLTLVGIFSFYLSSLGNTNILLVIFSIFIFSIGVSGVGQFITVKLIDASQGNSSFTMSCISLASGASVIIFPWLMGAQAASYGIKAAFITPIACAVVSFLLSLYLYFRKEMA